MSSGKWLPSSLGLNVLSPIKTKAKLEHNDDWLSTMIIAFSLPIHSKIIDCIGTAQAILTTTLLSSPAVEGIFLSFYFIWYNILHFSSYINKQITLVSVCSSWNVKTTSKK